MRKINIEIPGHPEPAVRVTKRSLWRGQKAAAWKSGAAALIRSKARGRKLETPCSFTAWIYGRSLRADVDNYLKLSLDSCVQAGIIPNDNCKNVQAAHVYFLRAEKDKEYVLIELESE